MSLIEEIYDEITKLMESGADGQYQIKISRLRAREFLLDDCDYMDDDFRERVSSGNIDDLNGLMIPNIPPKFPVVIPLATEADDIPGSLGFIIERIR